MVEEQSSESPAPVALVTGASRGIGRAIATELARAGLDIVVNCARRKDAADETAAEVREMGRQAIVVLADVGTRDGRDRLLSETRSAFGRLDVLVNNAALAPRERRDLLEATEKHYDETLAVNLRGAFFMTQAAARWMVDIRKRRPDRPLYIVNISSISEYTSSTQRGDYCLAKAGLGMLTRLFADRLAGERILVNEVRPGIIRTDMTRGVEDRYNRLIADGFTPVRRWGEPEDVARAVRALVTGAFDFSTGAAFDVDGGFHLRRL